MPIFILWFFLTLVVSSFVEYWAHRLMHLIPQFCPVHSGHHERNTGQGVWGEFKDYFLPTSPLMGIMFLFSWEIGVSCTLGGMVYASYAAYAHQLQHESPIQCVWMSMPVHHVHHKYNQWHHNFGIGVDFWDRVFGTYKPMEWLEPSERDHPNKGYFKIQWR